MIAPTPELEIKLELTVLPKETAPVAFALVTVNPLVEFTAPLNDTAPVAAAVLFTVKVPVLFVTIPPTVNTPEPEWLIVPRFGAVIAAKLIAPIPELVIVPAVTPEL